MNVMYPGIDRMKGWRNAMIDYLASYLPQSQIPNPPTFGMNAVFAPSSYQDVGRGVMNALIPEPEDTMMGLMKPSLKDFIRANPHSGGVLTGNAKLFNELPDDAIVTVFHATNKQNADKFIKNETGWTYPGEGIKGKSNKLYVGSDPISVSGYGDEILGMDVYKNQLIKSPEAKYKKTIGDSILDASVGALLNGRPIKIVRINSNDKYKRAYEALENAGYFKKD